MRLLLLHPSGCGAGLFYELGSLNSRLVQHFLARSLGARQFGLDLVRVGQALSNTLFAQFQHLKDRLVGHGVEYAGHNAEADDLGNKMVQVQVEHLVVFHDI